MDPFGVMFLPFVAQESKWMVLDLSQQLAQFRHLIVCVGHVDFDSQEIREDLRKLRRRCVELCRGIKGKIWPHVQGNRSSSDEIVKQFRHLILSMEIFLADLRKLYSLTRTFPMQRDFSKTSNDVISYKSESTEEDVILPGDELVNIHKDLTMIVDLRTEMQDKIPRVLITDEDLYEGFNPSKRTRRKERNLTKCTIMCCVCKEYYI